MTSIIQPLWSIKVIRESKKTLKIDLWLVFDSFVGSFEIDSMDPYRMEHAIGTISDPYSRNKLRY